MDMLGAVAKGAITGLTQAASAMTTEDGPEVDNKAPATRTGTAEPDEPPSGSPIDTAVADVAAETKKVKK